MSEDAERRILEAINGVSAEVKEIRVDVSGLKSDVAGLKMDVAGLKTDVAELKTDVAELKSDVAELKTDVAVLKTDVAELKTDVAGLKEDVTVLKSDVAGLKEDVAVLQTDVAGLKADMSVMQENMDAMQGEIVDLKQNMKVVQTDVAGLKQNMETVQGEIGGEEATGKRVRRSNALLYNPSYPFAHADIDRTVLGEDAGLECKTTSALNLRQFRNVEFPEQYYVQCVHYLAVTGCQRWYLAVLVFGRGFFTFTLERDQAEIDALMAAEERFWALVEQDTPPALDGLEATGAALQVLYPSSRNSSVELFGREAMLSEYVALQDQKKELAQRISQIENTIKADMQDAESGRCGAYTVSWKTQTRRLFQPKEFSLAHPEIDLQEFYRDSSSRPFRVREISEDQRQAG